VSPGQLIFQIDVKVWHLVVNVVDGVAALTIKMIEKDIGGCKCLDWAREPNAMPYSWLCVLDEDKYISRRVEHIGHAWRLLRNKTPGNMFAKILDSKDFKGPSFKLIGKDESMRKGAAWDGFKNYGITVLKTFAKDVELVVPAGGDIFDYVDALVRHYLKDEKLDESAILDILAERFEENDDNAAVSNILDSKECAEGFGEEELKVLNSWKANRVKMAKANKVAREKIASAKTEYCKKYNDKEKKTHKVKLRGLVSDGTRLYGKIHDAGTLTSADALNHLPPGSTAQRSTLENR
jgi:hypothetical protein